MTEEMVDWLYYYTTMWVILVHLLAMVCVIGLHCIQMLFTKVKLEYLESHSKCIAYRDYKISDLIARLDQFKTAEERDQIFDEMREYRKSYLLNRKDTF